MAESTASRSCSVVPEPVLDPISGLPVSGPLFHADAAGARVRCRVWRGRYVTDFEGAEARLERLLQQSPGEFQPQADDLLIAGYLKCGTHWLHEIAHFLLSNQCQRRPPNKENFMLEFKPIELLNSCQKPRIFNCHLPVQQLPQGFSKIVLTLRNPKDVAVSLYHHYTSIADYSYSSSFHSFLRGLFLPGTLDGGSYFTRTRDYLAAVSTDPEFAARVHLVEFEKLKANTADEVERLDRFLTGGRAAPELVRGICDMVSFEQMQKDRGADMGHLFATGPAAGSGFYRKGGVGDWRNWFTDEDSTTVDQMVQESLGDFDWLYKPTYGI